MYHPRAALGTGARLVEADMPRLANAEELNVYPPSLANGFLVAKRLQRQLLARYVSSRDPNVVRLNVDVVEQILPHEAVIRMNAVRGHRIVLVQIERDDVPEAETLFAVHADELPIHADRRRSGSKSENGVLIGRILLTHQRRDARRHQPRDVVVLVDDDGADPFHRCRVGMGDVRRPAIDGHVAGPLGPAGALSSAGGCLSTHSLKR